jgi:hypothetical protein
MIRSIGLFGRTKAFKEIVVCLKVTSFIYDKCIVMLSNLLLHWLLKPLHIVVLTETNLSLALSLSTTCCEIKSPAREPVSSRARIGKELASSVLPSFVCWSICEIETNIGR